MSSSSDIQHSWGGGSVSGKVGASAKVVELVLAWLDASAPRDVFRAVDALIAHLADPSAVVEYDVPTRRAMVTLSPNAFTRLHNREFRRPYKPAPSSFTVALGEGRLVEFVSRKEARGSPGQLCGWPVPGEDTHDPTKAWGYGAALAAAPAGPRESPLPSDTFRLPLPFTDGQVADLLRQGAGLPSDGSWPAATADSPRPRDAALGSDDMSSNYNGVGATIYVGEA